MFFLVGVFHLLSGQHFIVVVTDLSKFAFPAIVNDRYF